MLLENRPTVMSCIFLFCNYVCGVTEKINEHFDMQKMREITLWAYATRICVYTFVYVDVYVCNWK